MLPLSARQMTKPTQGDFIWQRQQAEESGRDEKKGAMIALN